MDDNEHQVVRDLRMLNGYPDDTPQPEVFRREAIKLTMLNPTARAEAIRNLENTIIRYDTTSNLRQQTQGFRLTQTLKTAHERLKAAGR
jgi:hypothetical protein